MPPTPNDRSAAHLRTPTSAGMGEAFHVPRLACCLEAGGQPKLLNGFVAFNLTVTNVDNPVGMHGDVMLVGH